MVGLGFNKCYLFLKEFFNFLCFWYILYVFLFIFVLMFIKIIVFFIGGRNEVVIIENNNSIIE